ncbi:MAG: alpha/beta hydrolase [Burkholderiales bacterium]|nr:alpha/beta hydrolase [Burkholderiales bacterium]
MTKQSRSEFLDVRGLRYHVRTWGNHAGRPLWLLHGWMDVSASFQFVVDELAGEYRVLAPDWRGFGLTQWAAGGYWFPDYLGDLDALLRAFTPEGAVDIVGHSMGGNVANLYAGARPARVRRLALLEGFGLARMAPSAAPARYEKWLDELAEAPSIKPYGSLDEVAARLMRNNPRLPPERAHFLAPHWSVPRADGSYGLAGDPAHKMVNPVLYRLEEAIACWRRIEAPVLWVWGDGQWLRRWFRSGEQDLAERRAAFRDLREATLPECGHMMHHDQPAALARLLDDFLNR